MNGVINAIAGVLTGVLSGFGVGGGTLLILYMQNFTNIPLSTAQGINLAYFIPTALASLWGHIRSGFIEKRVFFLSGISGTSVALLVSWMAGDIPRDIGRKIFGVFLVVVGIYELIRGKRREKNN